jgi:hypothetical protein
MVGYFTPGGKMLQNIVHVRYVNETHAIVLLASRAISKFFSVSSNLKFFKTI